MVDYDENYNPDPQPGITADSALEKLLDLIADALIQSEFVDTTTVEENQKFIRNGLLQPGQGSGVLGVLALFQKDIKANQSDNTEVLKVIADSIIDFDTLLVSINGGTDFGISIGLSGGGLNGSENITEFLVQDGTFSNVSQFIPLQQSSSIVDVEKAEEFLDTNIYELLPTGDIRQARITRFFQELNALLPSQLPQFDITGSIDQGPDGRVDRDTDGNWIGSLDYSQDNSISYAQDNIDGTIDEEDAFIHRLKFGAVPANSTNSSKTIEDIYNTILPYLTDILEEPPILLDGRPEYKNNSDGYLQFRNLNQGIIIRNTNKEFVEGLNPSNPTWLTTDYNGLLDTYSTDATPYEFTTNFILNSAGTGFTITMWVRFLDKVSSGTLFNFGNPTKVENPFGFKLETYIVNRDDPAGTSDGETDYTNFGEFVDANDYLSNTLGLFKNTNSERFVRLQVREFGDTTPIDTDLGLRDSHIGNPSMKKFSWNPPELNSDNPDWDDLRLLSTTHIPQDFNEWYFICATYNPNVNEPTADDDIYGEFQNNSDFWMNHIDPNTGEFVGQSFYGNKCKVEIISRSDLLRARGFKV